MIAGAGITAALMFKRQGAKVAVLEGIPAARILGKGADGYREALEFLGVPDDGHLDRWGLCRRWWW